MAESPITWHTLSVDEVLSELRSRTDGLSGDDAARRLEHYGPNLIPAGKSRTLYEMFFGQFREFMIVVLLAAAVISGIVGEAVDTIAIVVIVLLNAIIGTVQEFRAEGAVAALRNMTAPEAHALRDGKLVTIPAAELVNGDIVRLEAGNIVPADLRLLEVEELQVDESALTGESVAVSKHCEPLAERKLAVGDRLNLAFRTSLVTRGRASGIVVATGLASEIGRIADMLSAEPRLDTLLQRRLARFGRNIALAVIAVCAIVFGAGLLQGQPVVLMFLTAVSLAVAAIPEALPALVTVSLAVGARKLTRHNALVRNLPAVETLGSVSYICTDKTGTLTENVMTAERFVLDGDERETLPGPDVDARWSTLATALALNNDVTETDGEPAGEPTELALYKAAAAAGFSRATLSHEMPRVGVVAFDSTRKLMTTIHETSAGIIAYTKGAPERVLERCADPGQHLATADRLAHEGYRVLAFAERQLPSLPTDMDAEAIESDLRFLGLVALIDPPRSEVPGAVADCIAASIAPVMVTGDHPGTAEAIARRLGILTGAEAVVSADDLAALSDEAFARQVQSIRVYARVSPEQKLRIVKALQSQGEFVAMTGDGVNDAPALKRANIGVAMGGKGTDVSREAADMVLLDDNFTTIVRTVREGRRIFDNIRKFIKYMMSSNAGEILTLFLAPFLGLPIPLLPIHILWINLVTDGLPALAFTAERAEPGIMQRPPRPPEESFFAHGLWQYVIWVGLLIGGVSLASQAWAIARDVAYWQTIVFTVLTFSQIFHSFAVRSEIESVFSVGLTSNRPLLGAVALSIALQLVVIYVPACNAIFHTQPLPLFDLFVCFAFGLVTLVAVECWKWRIRRKSGRAITAPTPN